MYSLVCKLSFAIKIISIFSILRGPVYPTNIVKKHILTSMCNLLCPAVASRWPTRTHNSHLIYTHIHTFVHGEFSPFSKKNSNKPLAPLFLKYCRDFKTYFLKFFKEQFVSGGNICLYICINIDRLCLVYNVYIHYTFPKQILWLMPIFKRKMRVCRAFSA